MGLTARVPSGGILNIANSTISTAGYEMNGLVTGPGGVTTFAGGSIATSGAAAYGASSSGGGATTISGTHITTTANGSGGLGVNGAGSVMDATNVSISTQGAFDSESGKHAYGVYNGPDDAYPSSGGTANLTNLTVATHGLGMYGIFTSTGGVTTISGGAVSTSGADATGVLASAGGSTAISGAAVATAGGDAPAVAVLGSGSKVSLAGANLFTTGGAGAFGLYAGDSRAHQRAIRTDDHRHDRRGLPDKRAPRLWRVRRRRRRSDPACGSQCHDGGRGRRRALRGQFVQRIALGRRDPRDRAAVRHDRRPVGSMARGPRTPARRSRSTAPAPSLSTARPTGSMRPTAAQSPPTARSRSPPTAPTGAASRRTTRAASSR